MPQTNEYRREIWRRAKERAQLLQPWRIYSGIGSAVLSPLVQWKAGRVNHLSLALVSGGIGVTVYVMLTAGEYAYKALFVAPAEIWQENQSRIAKMERELSAIRNNAWPVSFRAETRQAIVDRLSGIHTTFSIYHNAPSNCADFAVALRDVLTEAHWLSQQVGPVQSRPRLSVGVRIEGAAKQTNALAGALKEIFNIEARTTITESSGSGTQIFIGEKAVPI